MRRRTGKVWDPTRGFPGEGPTQRRLQEGQTGQLQKTARRRREAVKSKPATAAVSISPTDVTQQRSRRIKLLAKAVQASTGKAYLREMDRFLDYITEYQLPFVSDKEKDETLANYLGHVHHDIGGGPERGACVLSGWVMIQPEIQHRLPISWRAMLSWRRSHVAQEGGPIGEQTLAALIQIMRDLDYSDAADIALLAWDGYLREGEAINVRAQDVVFAKGKTVILLGPSSRGERTKTGSDQGIILDWPGTTEMLKRRVQQVTSNGKLFNIKADTYRKMWTKAYDELRKLEGCEGVAHMPPHSVRHSGPSRDCQEGYRSLESILKRGRWSSLKSVNRYAKPFAWITANHNLPPVIAQKAEKVLRERGDRAMVAGD